MVPVSSELIFTALSRWEKPLLPTVWHKMEVGLTSIANNYHEITLLRAQGMNGTVVSAMCINAFNGWNLSKL